MMISAGVILGPTPAGAFCTVAGTVLWVGSAIYVHREGIKKAVTGAVNWAKDTGGKIVDGTKKVVGGIANGTKILLNKISWW